MTSPTFHLLSSVPEPISPSSHASEAQGFVFLTGQIGRDLENPDAPLPTGVAGQTERTLSNLMTVLSGLGLERSQVVSVRVYLTNFARDYDVMNGVYGRFFTTPNRPARTCIGVTSLAKSALVEIDCIASRGAV
jgi:reactive intermediate/imine deaminase